LLTGFGLQICQVYVKFCYCKHTQARFRNWLKAKYGTLERLNLAWYRTFENWEDVEAPRFGTILSHADFMDWMSFTTDKLAQDLHSKAEAVKSVDGKHITTSHSGAPSVSTSPFDDHGVPDDWKMSNVKSVDFYGSSYYPKHAMSPLGGRPAGERSFLYAGAYSASKQKGFFVGELQAGQGVTGMRVNEPTTAEDQRDWVWSLIANGAKSIFFFAYYPMNAGYESNGYGLINLDGTLTDRAISSGRIGHVISKYGPLFMHAMPEPAQFAILFNPLTHLTGNDPCNS
jgi:beta-galactosidase GanA